RDFEGRARRMILGGFSLYALLGLHDVLVGAGLIQGLLLFDFAPVLVSAVLGYLLAARLIRLETDLQAEVDVQTRELRAGQDRLVALLGAVQTMMADLDLGTSLERIVDEASRLAGAAHVALLLVERERGVLRLGAAAGGAAAPGVEVPLGSGYSGAVATSGQPLYIADMRSDPTALLAQRDRPEGAVTYLGLPVRMRGEVLGVLTFHTEAPHEYGHAELAHLGSFADQAALVLWNARMVEELKSRQARLEALIESTRQLSAVQSVGALLSRIAESCGRLLDCCAVGFRLVEGDELVVGATWGDPEHLTLAPRLPIGASLGGRVAERGEPIVVRNLAEDERLAPEQRVLARRLGHRAWMGVPVKVGPRVLGVLGVRTKREQGFGEGDLELAMAFASQAAIALENARLLDGLGVRVKRLRTLTRVNQLISRSLDPQAVLEEIARSVARLMDAAVASFWLADESARALTLVGFSDPAVAADWPHKTLGFDQGVIGWVATQRQSLLVADVFADGRIVAPQWWERHGLKSFLGIPIALDGQLLAVLALNDRRPLRLGPEDENLLGSFAAQAAAAIRNARLYSAEAEARRQAEAALAEVKRLRGLLPICSYCKKIRNDGNYWEQIEHYISTHSEANFSHGICPDCRQTVVVKQLEAWKGAR
ncbi:MAG TPA: GAF domain-containing protein, partial [Methylomirabilota bacterium]|nr:GAF domain-containing protein [Methylomirabilota bacterium]